MALIACPDCGTEISELAPACVKCGRPMVVVHAGPGMPTRPQPNPVQARSGVGDGVKIGIGMFIVLPLLLAVGGCGLFFLVMAVGHASR